MNKTAIEFISPPEQAVTIDGREIVIRPITMRQLPALVRCVEPVLGDVMSLAAAPSGEGALQLLARHGAAIIEALVICTGEERAKIEQMTPDRAAVLLLAAAQVNADFFVQAVPSLKAQASSVAPLLAAKWAELQAGGSTSGAPPSTA